MNRPKLQPKKGLSDFHPRLDSLANDGQRLGPGHSIVRRVTTVDYEEAEGVRTRKVREYAHKTHTSFVDSVDGKVEKPGALREFALMLYLQRSDDRAGRGGGENGSVVRIRYAFFRVWRRWGREGYLIPQICDSDGYSRSSTTTGTRPWSCTCSWTWARWTSWDC